MGLVFEQDKKSPLSAESVKKMMDIGGKMNDMLNKDVVKKFGVEVVYWRALPHKNSADVIFQDYTLLDVEDCPTTLNVIFSDQAYNQGDMGVSIYELGYNVPLELQIPAVIWYEAYGGGTMPQKGDIVYIPVLHKLFEVDSTSEVYGFMQQFTHFKAVMKKYTQKQYRGEGENLAETIDDYTTGTEELLGLDILDEIADITSEQQTDPYNSTPWDNFKYVADADIIKEKTFIVGNTDIFRTYYDLSSVKKGYLAVEYKDDDEVEENSYRLLSLWAKPNFPDEATTYDEVIVKDGKERINGIAYETIVMRRSKRPVALSVGEKYIVSVGKSLKQELTLKAIHGDHDEWYITFADRLNLDKIQPNWRKSKITIATSNPTQIISSPNESISLSLGKDYVNLSINGVDNTTMLGTILKDEQWYGISLTMMTGGDSSLRIYAKKGSGISVVAEVSIASQLTAGLYQYSLLGGDVCLSNIRLYKSSKPFKDNERKIDLLSRVIKNGSKAVICDSVELPSHIGGVYVGRQR